MRFVDASVFLYAFLKPRRPLPKHLAEAKESAKKIVERIDRGLEEVVTTVVHLSEVASIIEARAGSRRAIEVI